VKEGGSSYPIEIQSGFPKCPKESGTNKDAIGHFRAIVIKKGYLPQGQWVKLTARKLEERFALGRRKKPLDPTQFEHHGVNIYDSLGVINESSTKLVGCAHSTTTSRTQRNPTLKSRQPNGSALRQ
jgi:hypothetical protein